MVVLFHELLVDLSDGGHRKLQRIRSSLLDFGTPNGYTAMAKTVGLPAAIAAKLLLEGPFCACTHVEGNLPETDLTRVAAVRPLIAGPACRPRSRPRCCGATHPGVVRACPGRASRERDPAPRDLGGRDRVD